MKIADILRGEVDLTMLLECLSFNPDDLEVAAVVQAKLFHGAACLRVQKMANRTRIASMVEAKRSAISLRLRRKYKGMGEKITEGHLLALIRRNEDFDELEKKLAKAEEEEEYSKLLMEAYRQRRDALRIIQEKRSAEARIGSAIQVRTEEAVQVTDIRKKFGSRYPGKRGSST